MHDNGLPPLALTSDKLIFDSGGVWRLYRIDNPYVLVLGNGTGQFIPWTIAILESSLREIQLFTTGERTASGLYPDPLETGLGQRLLVLWLAHHGGLMVHGCGVVDDEKGYLFAGNSGHGKSTMARLWQGHGTILCDERVVIRHVNGQFRIYGTPWHSDVTEVSAGSARVDKIFFLGHHASNESRRQTATSALAKLLARAYHPFWDETGMNTTLDFCSRLVDSVPSYELLFAPNEQMIDFVRRMSNYVDPRDTHGKDKRFAGGNLPAHAGG